MPLLPHYIPNARGLIQPLLLPQVPERSYISQGKGKAKLVFIAHRTQRKSPVLDVACHSNPRLYSVCAEAYCRKFKCASKPMFAAPVNPRLFALPVSQQDAVLIETLWLLHHSGKQRIGGSLQKGIATAYREKPKAIIQNRTVLALIRPFLTS